MITNRKAALKKACKPNLKRLYTFHKDLTIMEMGVTKLTLNKPVYVTGFSVFEGLKLHMYCFHYYSMLNWFDKNFYTIRRIKGVGKNQRRSAFFNLGRIYRITTEVLLASIQP